MLIKPYIELQQLMERKGYNQKELAAAISRRLNGYMHRGSPTFWPHSKSTKSAKLQ